MIVLALGCNRAGAPPTDAPATTPSPAPPCAALELEPTVVALLDGTPVRLSDHEVFADAFTMRWVKREDGQTEHIASVDISVRDVDVIGTSYHRVGDSVDVGRDRYCITAIDDGVGTQPGSVSLRRIVPQR